MSAPAGAFPFGRNWQRYVDRYLDAERVAVAEQSLRDVIDEDLAGRTFVDVGCGSGLFSLGAHRAGAFVVSFDVDPESVAACRELRRRAGDPGTWTVLDGSILDEELVDRLPQGDVVYSWGVLHHTGDMWRAIEHAARLVRPGGLLVLAIYNRSTGRFLDSERWLVIKRRYNRSGPPARRLMEIAHLGHWIWSQMRARKNPVRVAREYKGRRGMALRTDLVDWLGGYPYEYATADEIVAFCSDRLGLRPVEVRANPPTGIGNNQFVFRREAA